MAYSSVSSMLGVGVGVAVGVGEGEGVGVGVTDGFMPAPVSSGSELPPDNGVAHVDIMFVIRELRMLLWPG